MSSPGHHHPIPPGGARADERRRRLWRGHLAEYAAAALLLAKGYRIHARRWRCPAGEIDLIVSRSRRLAFVEVKQRQSVEDAEAAISDHQSGRIQSAADTWLQRNPHYQDFEIGFDIVFVVRGMWPRHIPNGL